MHVAFIVLWAALTVVLLVFACRGCPTCSCPAPPPSDCNVLGTTFYNRDPAVAGVYSRLQRVLSTAQRLQCADPARAGTGAQLAAQLQTLFTVWGADALNCADLQKYTQRLVDGTAKQLGMADGAPGTAEFKSNLTDLLDYTRKQLCSGDKITAKQLGRFAQALVDGLCA